MKQTDTSFTLYSIDPVTGKELSEHFSSPENKSINEDKPAWLACQCKFSGDTLNIRAGISLFFGFAVSTSIYRSKAYSEYTEFEREKVFRISKTSELVNEINLPANIEKLSISTMPHKGMDQLYGQLSVKTEGFYDSRNAWGFKDGFLYASKHIKFYFRCRVE